MSKQNINRIILFIVTIFATIFFPVTTSASENKINNIFPDTNKYELTDPLPERVYGVFCDENSYNEYNSYASSGAYGFTLKRDNTDPKQMIIKTYKLDWDKPDPKGTLFLQRIITNNGSPKPLAGQQPIKASVTSNMEIAVTIPDNGMWCITWDTPYYDIVGYVEVIDNKAYALRPNICLKTATSTEWDKIQKNVLTKATLDKNLTRYPVEENDPLSDLNQTKDIQELSDKLIAEMEKTTGRQLTDSEKIYAILKYMYGNYAFDDWRMKKDPRTWRADILNDCTDPMNFTFSSHVGVCHDFAIIFVIMARYQNVPAMAVATETHIIPAAYINNEWTTFDITHVIPRKCPTQDTSVKNWTKVKTDEWYDCMACDPKLDDMFVSYTLWDADKTESTQTNNILRNKY